MIDTLFTLKDRFVYFLINDYVYVIIKTFNTWSNTLACFY